MPQFDPSSFASQVFWLVISFIALYWLISKVAVPRVGEAIDNRARVIQEDIDRATQLKAETDAAAASYERGMADARGQAQEHMRAMQAELKALTDKRTEEVAGQVAKQVSEAEARIDRARKDALQAMREVAAETAREVVAKLAGVAPDAHALETAVAGAIAGQTKDRT